MSRALVLYRSAIFKKAVMAVTGIMLFGFIVSHMAGNLKVFFGPQEINQYAEALRELGKPFLPKTALLWILRFGLLGAAVLHIWSAVALTLENKRARPKNYAVRKPVQMDFAQRTMRYSGFLILGYLIYHILHFTTGQAHPDFVYGDVYRNLVIGFENPLVVAVYIVVNVMLAFHLYHGLWSMFQSLGINHPSINGLKRPFAAVFAVVVCVGFIAVPISVLIGVVG